MLEGEIDPRDPRTFLNEEELEELDMQYQYEIDMWIDNERETRDDED